MYFCHQHTTDHFVIEDAIFGRMDDIGDMFKKEVHEEFIKNSLLPAKCNLLPEYSYIYVLVAHGPSNSDVPCDDKHWCSILNKEQNAFLEEHRAYIIAWMLMTPEHPIDIHFIEFVDTRVKGYNLTDCMIKKFENELAIILDESNKTGCTQIKPKCVFPKEILKTSSRFWQKYFQKRYDIYDKTSLYTLSDTLKIGSIVHWKYLENILE